MHRLVLHTILVSVCSLLVSSVLFADIPHITPAEIPNTAHPGVVGNTLTEQKRPIQTSKPMSQVEQPKQMPGTLGPQAEKIKFQLKKIVIDGNHVYSDKVLSALYKDKIGKNISVAELMDIVQNVTNYYRNNGYILSRAVLPPQHVANGEVHIRVLEGFVDDVKIIGTPKGAHAIIKAYLNKVIHSRPLQIHVLEYYLRLANNVPGVHVKAVLEPSEKTLAAATLNVIADLDSASSYVSYDNYGSLYMGPDEGTVSAAINSIFRSGDSTQFTYISTARPKELKYKDLSYSTPLGPNGWKFVFDMNQSNTRPGLNLRPLKINGLSNTYTGTISYPLILARDTDLSLNAGFNYTDSGVTAFGERLYLDHIRSLRAGADYSHADTYAGVNSFSGSVENGFGILGATTNNTSPFTSRFGASGKFTKFNLQLNRVQRFGASRYSANLLAKGQYSFNPLLASEQMPFGGSQLGRGYDSADIIGDLGAAGSIEFRMDISPGWRLLQFLQPYVFYDGGVIWNRKNIPGSKTKQSETSTGFGIRFLFTPHVSGNLMLAQPLTKQDATEEVVGNGRRPRGFFSVTVNL